MSKKLGFMVTTTLPVHVNIIVTSVIFQMTRAIANIYFAQARLIEATLAITYSIQSIVLNVSMWFIVTIA